MDPCLSKEIWSATTTVARELLLEPQPSLAMQTTCGLTRYSGCGSSFYGVNLIALRDMYLNSWEGTGVGVTVSEQGCEGISKDTNVGI